MLNQEVHKNLRRNKNGIHLDRIENLSPSYKRPAGFTLVPTLLNAAAAMQNKNVEIEKSSPRHHHHYRDRQQMPAVPNMQKPPTTATTKIQSQMMHSNHQSRNEMIR